MTIQENSSPTAMYQRSVSAKLIVRTEHGEEWPATEGDLDKFGAISCRHAYGRFLKAWEDLLRVFGFDDVTEAELNPIRYLVECSIHYASLGTVEEHVGADVLDQIAELEHVIRSYRQLHEQETSDG